MAGRPVTVHGGQSTLLYWLIVMVILMVAFLGLFIFQLTTNKGLETRARRAEDRARTYGTPPQYYADEATGRKTPVFNAMADDLKRVAGRVTGAPEDVGLTIIAKADQTLRNIAERKEGVVNPTDALLTALERLDQQHTEERDRANSADASVKDLQAEREALTTQLDTTRTQFEEQVQGLRGQLERAQDEKNTALGQKDEQLRALQTELNAARQQITRQEREGLNVARGKDVEIGRLETLVANLQKQIAALKPSMFDPNAILTKADGRVLRAVPGSEVVYINLGAPDKVKVGMGFEVFSQTREAPTGLRGKASLEIATVMENTAECRVTRRDPSHPILEGDLVVNIAYERERKPKFVVRGDFDLNYDGTVDFDGAGQVAGLIRQWGGQIADDLDSSVDFVVIGLAPNIPPLPNGPTSDVVRDQAQRRELQASQFAELVDAAQRMHIPVITQNQFLFLTGFTGEGTMAHR